VPGTIFRNRRILTGLILLSVLTPGLILLMTSEQDVAPLRAPNDEDAEPAQETVLVVRAVVVDQAGRPLPGAEVRVYRPENDRLGACEIIGKNLNVGEGRTPLEVVTADASGVGAFRTLASGTYDFEAEAAGYAVGFDSNAFVPPAAPARPIRITLALGMSLAGTVRNHEGEPLSGAWVTVIRRPSTTGLYLEFVSVRTVTDDAGRFSFSNLAGGLAVLRVNVDGYPVKGLSEIEIGRHETIDIVIGGTAVVEGVVSDEDGHPVSGASVTALNESRESYMFATTSTIAGGRYRLARLPAGNVVIIVSGRGYATWPGVWPLGWQWDGDDLTAGKTLHKDITLTRGAIVTGRVTEAGTGQPVVGAEIRAVDPLSLTIGGPVPCAVTGDDGSYRLVGIALGKHLLAVRAPGYSQPALLRPIQALFGPRDRTGEDMPILLDVKETDGEIRRDLELRPAARITGRVVSTGGQPVAWASVGPCDRGGEVAMNMRFAGLGALPVLTDADGVFRLTNVADDEPIRLFAVVDGFARGVSEPLGAAPGAVTKDIVIRLKALGLLEGLIVGPAGRPLAGAWVTVAPDGRRSLVEIDPILTDASGRFRFEDLPQGLWVVRAKAPDHGPDSLEGVLVRSGRATSDLILGLERWLVIEGVVLDDVGRTIAGAQVDLRMMNGGRVPETDDDRLPWGIRGKGSCSRTDAMGRFRFDRLVAGDYGIRATKEDFIPGVIQRISPGDADPRVTLHRYETISGHVLGLDGQPVAGVRIDAFGEDSSGKAVTDEDGAFRIEGLRDEKFNLFAVPPVLTGLRYALLRDIPAGSDRLNIRLEAGHEITGVVVDEEGRAVPRVNVTASGREADGERRAGPALSAVTDDDGKFTVTGLDGGMYRVYAWSRKPRQFGEVMTAGRGSWVMIVLKPWKD
jgi:large repetitive protein